MKTSFALALALSLGLSSQAFAARAASPSLNTGLAGKIGIGFDSIPGANTGGAPAGIAGISTPNALSLRYWASDSIGWEALLALSTGSQTAGPTTTSTNVFGVGAGMKYNWKRPSENFLVQWIAKVSFANAGTTTSGSTTSTGTLALFAGSGFEAFIPAWPAVSVEGSVGLGLSSQTVTPPVGPTNSQSSFGVNGGGFTPISVALHYYFD